MPFPTYFFLKKPHRNRFNVFTNFQCLSFIEENRRDFGIRATKRLAVSGAFHTPLMQPAYQVTSIPSNAQNTLK